MKTIDGLICTSTVAIALALTGCTTEVPLAIDGPWAAEFQEMYNASTIPFVRDVLVDGTISDQEYAEMLDRFESCMDDAGISVVFNADGSYEADFAETLGPNAANAANNRCSDESGEYPIGALYSWARRNPDNLDEPTILTACLIEKGAVAENYTVEEYVRDNETQSYPYVDKELGPIAMDECLADPLGLFE